MITILFLPAQFLDWQPTVLRFAKNCTNTHEQFSLQLLSQDPRISALETIGERVEFETAILQGGGGIAIYAREATRDVCG